MLVEMRSVEVSKRTFIGRKMRRYPIENHGNTTLMQIIDEVHQILRCAIPAGRGEVTGRLISPRAIERMLGKRQKLDVRERGFLEIVGEWFRNLAVTHRSIVVF